MSRRWILLALAAYSAAVFGESPYLFLFRSAKERTERGLDRQKARKALAEANFQRAKRLIYSNAISREEYEIFFAAATVAAFDLDLAQIRAKENALSLEMALGLGRQGRRIPLCKKKMRKDENTVSAVLKQIKPIKPLEIVEPPTGTQVELAKAAEETAPPPEAPEAVRPPEAPEVPEAPTTGGGSTTPPIDFDVVLPPTPPVTPPKPPGPKPKK